MSLRSHLPSASRYVVHPGQLTVYDNDADKYYRFESEDAMYDWLKAAETVERAEPAFDTKIEERAPDGFQTFTFQINTVPTLILNKDPMRAKAMLSAAGTIFIGTRADIQVAGAAFASGNASSPRGMLLPTYSPVELTTTAEVWAVAPGGPFSLSGFVTSWSEVN